MVGTREFEEARDFFEKNIGKAPGIYLPGGSTREAIKAQRAARRDDLSVPTSHFYEKGETDAAFKAFLFGYQYGKAAL